MLLSKADLTAKATASGRPRAYVPVPEFGDGAEVLVQGMSGVERDQWEKSLLVIKRGTVRDRNLTNVRARLVVRCLINEDGTRMYTDAEAELVGGWRVDVLNRVYECCQKLNGVSDKDADELGRYSGTVEDGSDSNSSSASS